MLTGADGSWISLLPAQLPGKNGLTRETPSKPHPFHDKMQARERIVTICYLSVPWATALHCTGAQGRHGR